jgi:hypothetical protein
MVSVIWAGAGNAADIFFLIGAILAGLYGLFVLFGQRDPAAALIPAAICLVALGLLAL